MTDATNVPCATTADDQDASGTFTILEDALRAQGPTAILDCLIDQLDASRDYRALLDALLLKARHELGLPLFLSGSLADIPEPARTQYEEKYVTAIRLVGSRYLETGDIPTAWAYYRAISEPEPIAAAIRDYRPSENDERLGAIIEVAFNHGVSPDRGFELIMENYGTCPAITAFEQLPAQDETTRIACANRLIRHLHRELTANIRSQITSQGEAPPDEAPLCELVTDHPWLFADDAYHIDISHLASVVRMSLFVRDPDVMKLAVDLTEYGRRLSPRLTFDGPPPFQKIFDDHRIYLRAILGDDVNAAVAHFRGKLAAEHDGDETIFPAQTLVNLLIHVGHLDEAIDVASEQLADIPETALTCPGIAQLCINAGQPERLARIARDRNDLVKFTAASLQCYAQAAKGRSLG